MKLKLTWLLTLFMAFVMQFSFAQEKTVTGTVTTASDGFPLPGASVIVKGTSRGAQTDFDGKYSIVASVGDILVVSYVGMTPSEITVGTASVYDVALEEGNALDEVVIIGSVFDVGKERANGVSSVGANELKNVVATTSIDRALQGQMSGINVVASSTAPGSSAQVSVRGAYSLSASQTGGTVNPLYVVDGTYMNAADVPAINSANIESVQVLTDAAQTAIYGARAANGVVIIKTKQGVKGKTRVTLNTRYGWSDRFPIRIDLMNARQKLIYENTLAQVTDPISGANLGLGRARTQAEIDQLASRSDLNWGEDVLYKTGITSSYNLSISSGGENSNTRFSLGYDTDEGIVKGYDGFSRISASIANNTTINDRMNYGFTLNGVYTERDDPRDRQNVQSPFWSELYNNPYAPLFQTDADGNLVLDANGDPQFNISGTLNSFGYQVLDEIFYTDQEVRNFRLFGNAFFEVFVLKDLKVRTQFGGIYDRRQAENWLLPAARLNSFIGNPGGTKSDDSIDDLDYNWRNEITYGRSFGKHDFKATFATEYQNENFYRIDLNSQGFPNNFQNTQNLAGLIEQNSFTQRSRVTRIGVLGVLNYDYDNKYFLNGYLRRDGSSRAGFNNQYGNFYGVSASWDIGRESFMSDVSWVNSLKLSGSYGTIGDDGSLGLYSNFTSISLGGLLGNDPTALPNTTVSNPNASWETNEKLNIGLSFELLEGSRLRGKIDWFQDTRRDFILQDFLPVESGSFNTFINAGTTRNRGVEVDLNYDVFRNPEGFNLTVFGNVTTLKAEVTELADEQFRSYSGGQVVLREGLEPFTHFLVRYAGVDPSNGDALYYDIDGNITNEFRASDAVAIDGKSTLPEFFGGFGFRANYKGFELSTNFNYSVGNYIYNEQSRSLHDPTNWRNNRVVDAFNYWQQSGDTNVLQRPTALGILQNTTQFLQDASYLSWRNLTFGYTFADNVFRDLPIDSVRAYFQAQNLAIWSDFQGNPEVGVGSSENGATVNGSTYINAYPQLQSFSVGFDINF